MKNFKNELYEIKIREVIDPCWAERFSGMEIIIGTHEDQQCTLLTGVISDQSSLLGFLNLLQNLNLTLISVSKIAQY
jgi:hypothetical protein